MIEIIRYPATTDNSNECKFSAAGNPLYFEISRKDFTVTGSGAYASAYLMVYIADVSSFTVNELIYLVGKDVGGVVIKSLQARILFVGANYLALNTPKTNPANEITQGWVNQLSDDKREIEVTGVLEYSALWSATITARRFSFNANGTVKVYINQILFDTFAKRYTVQSTGIALVEKVSLEMQLDFTDVTSTDTTSTTGYYGVKAVRQVPDDNRLINFEVYSYGAVVSTAKFLTAFERPVLFTGYPFHLYTLIGRNDDTVYFRNTAPTGLSLDTPFGSTHKGVYSINVVPQGAERRLTAQLITNLAAEASSLLIDDAGHVLNIDNAGNELRID